MERRLFATSMFALALVFFGMGAAEPSRPIDKLSWLVGGVWTADTATIGGGTQRIETRYEWTPNHSFIRFTTKFVTTNSANEGYAGDLFFDPAEQSLMIWYMNERNEITRGPMTVDGSSWTISFRGAGDIVGVSGPVDYRADIVRTTDDSYQWTLYANVAQAWKKLFALQYQRS